MPNNIRIICKCILVGTYLATIAAIILLSISYWILKNTYVGPRLMAAVVALACVVIAHLLARRGHYKAVAYLLVFFYGSVAAGIAWMWGPHNRMGLLLFGLVIVLSGILLSAKHTLMAAAAVCLLLLSINTAIVLDWHSPNAAAASLPTYGDIAAYCAVFSVIALVSWLYNKTMERSLAQAKAAEMALRRQQATLKQEVQKRTDELHKSQLKELEQLYRVAELGQLGVNLLHDLANHLTALSLEIEDMQSKQRTKAANTASEIMAYLHNVVDSTRARLHGGKPKRSFDIAEKINETLACLSYKAASCKVAINWQSPTGRWTYKGDPASFSQALTILINNAIDAYAQAKSQSPHTVTIGLQRSKTHLTITIADSGKGVPKTKQKEIFKPFTSAKKQGLGLGLYLAKQAIEGQFSGSLGLNTHAKQTEFIIKLPRNHV